MRRRQHPEAHRPSSAREGVAPATQMAYRATVMDFKQSFSHGSFYSLPEVERQGFGKVSRLPVSLRIVLESLLRNLDGKRVREADVRALASWQPRAERTEEIPFVVSRVLLQDFTGVPLVVDLAAMRGAVKKAAKPPSLIEPLVPVDLVIDHSVQVDFAKVPNALQLNMRIEFTRNRARYEFLKWGMSAFHGLQIVPPGMGIVHQVNLEYLSPGVHERGGVYYPDSLVGTDSHTTMINGLGIVAYGVGGIEAEAAMLGQPAYFLTPDVVGVHLLGAVRAGVTATDVVLTVTEMLRKAKVVGKFVEFFGEGAASLPVPERAASGYGKAKDEVGKRYQQVVEPPPVEHVAGGGKQEPDTVAKLLRDSVTTKDTNPLTEAVFLTNRPPPRSTLLPYATLFC